MIVRFLGRHIDQIAGNDDEIRTRQKSVEFFDAARQRRRSVNLLIRAQPNWLDIQIRNLRDQRARRRHLHRHTGSGGNIRTAVGSIASPTRSPGLITTEFGTSTIMALARLADRRRRGRRTRGPSLIPPPNPPPYPDKIPFRFHFPY